MDNTILRQKLAQVLTAASEGLLPAEADCPRADFYPMRRIKSRQELLWTLDYVAEAYPAPGVVSREPYLIYIDSYPEFHPVFLIGTLYTLLGAGAEVHVRAVEDQKLLIPRILEQAAKMELVRLFRPRDPYSDEETRKYIGKHTLTSLIFLGDAANSHARVVLSRGTCVKRTFSPADHLLISDFEREPVREEKHNLFADQCWAGSVDYEGYRAPTNRAKEVWLGFDYGDLFWGADAVVNDRRGSDIITDKIPAIIFTDRPRDQAWLPAGIEDCCDVVFFQDYDCRFPRYNFTQLV